MGIEHPSRSPPQGEATDEVLPPMPLGRMCQHPAELAVLVPEELPLDLYAALLEPPKGRRINNCYRGSRTQSLSGDPYRHLKRWLCPS